MNSLDINIKNIKEPICHEQFVTEFKYLKKKNPEKVDENICKEIFSLKNIKPSLYKLKYIIRSNNNTC